MGRPWRWRRCPECRKVAAGRDLINRHYGAAWNDGSAETECPYCGYVGPRGSFGVVREDHRDRLSRKGEAIRALSGMHVIPDDHQHRWSRHLSPLCVDCGTAR